MNKYGFVYIWFDRKRKMYYIGSHWGTEDDGYICSSNRMRNAFRRRPHDFSRKTLEKTSDRTDLLEVENKWLKMAEKKPNKYYNLYFDTSNNMWWHNEDKRLSVGEKISKANTGNPKRLNPWNKGKKLPENIRKQISKSTSIAMKKYYEKNPRSPETRRKISDNSKRLQQEKKIGMHGKTHTAETIQKMSDNNAMKNPEHVEKIRRAKKGIEYLNKNGKRKMAIPGSAKWDSLLQEGYKKGYHS